VNLRKAYELIAEHFDSLPPQSILKQQIILPCDNTKTVLLRVHFLHTKTLPDFVQGIQNMADGVEEDDIIHLGTDISESQFHLFGNTGLRKPLH